MHTEIKVSYRVVTPLFCAGAEAASPELRLFSFKGLLRYWWRVLAWARCDGDLERIQQQEDALFGSAGKGQSRVSMRLDHSRLSCIAIGEVLRIPPRNRVVGEGARYLGYGVMEAFRSRSKGTEAGQLTRACLRAPIDFTVLMRGRALDEEQSHSLTKALIALGTFGGMGAKSRKGYGSLVMQSLRVNGEEKWQAPLSINELKDSVADLASHCAVSTFPEYTALSKQARHVLVSSAKREPIELLDLIGREFVRFRSWGHNGKVLGSPSEKNFEDDHDLMVKQESESRKVHPRRIAFGLPHNYGKHEAKQVGPADSQLDRRASPLFIHIHECNNAPIAVLSFLPARFLPRGRSTISVGGTKVPQAREDKLYRPIHDFFNRLLDSSKRKERFTDVVEVRS